MAFSSVPRPYLGSALAEREHSRRRLVLLGVGGLIVLSTSPLFGHHVATRAGSLLAGHDHLWSLCLVAVHLLLAPVHGVFHVLLFAGLAYAAWDRARAWHRLRKTLRALPAVPPVEGDAFFTAAQSAGLRSTQVRIVEGLPSPAFTVGWFRPLVFLAKNLPGRLGSAELAAVCAHEAAHLGRRDPLRLTLLRFLGCTLFWLPALRRLADDLADEAEIDADDQAARLGPLVLASAILALAGQHIGAAGSPTGTAGFASAELLERRIRRLTGNGGTIRTHVTRRSLGFAMGVLAMVWISGIAVAHPLPTSPQASGHADHCEHHETPVWSHLFCLAGSAHGPGRPCPHTV
ncbi:MAG: M56 family metallopeptidase [Gemmatimonadaceae bacterium]